MGKQFIFLITSTNIFDGRWDWTIFSGTAKVMWQLRCGIGAWMAAYNDFPGVAAPARDESIRMSLLYGPCSDDFDLDSLNFHKTLLVEYLRERPGAAANFEGDFHCKP